MHDWNLETMWLTCVVRVSSFCHHKNQFPTTRNLLAVLNFFNSFIGLVCADFALFTQVNQ